MRRYNYKNKIIIITLLMVLMGVGYAYLSTSLTIKGTTNIGNVYWGIEFKNPDDTINENNVIPSSPLTIDEDKLNYTISLDKPGDLYEFTVDVVNTGTIDAMISDYVSKIKIEDEEEQIITSNNLPNYLIYSVTYDNGNEILNNHELKAGASEKIKVHIQLKSDISEEVFQSLIGKTIRLNISLDYKQLDNSLIDNNQQDING